MKEQSPIERRQTSEKEEVVRILHNTPIIQTPCAKANIGRATFYRWLKEDTVFANAVDKALHEGALLVNDMAESQLIGAIKDRNLTAIMFWLKHRHAVYKNRIEIDGTINTVHELSDEQKNLVERALRLADITLEEYERN